MRRFNRSENHSENQMNLKEILAVVGYSGLYKFISKGRNGVIVESLLDGKRNNLSSSIKISSLDDIAIFTETEEIPFEKILHKIYTKENGKPCISTKSDPEKLKAWFAEVLPEYDRNRVYVSDIKKIANWYNILLDSSLISFEETSAEEEVSE